MSDINNDNFIENAHEAFQQAVTEENFSLVQKIIEDMRAQGFEAVAESMEETLENIPMGKTK